MSVSMKDIKNQRDVRVRISKKWWNLFIISIAEIFAQIYICTYGIHMYTLSMYFAYSTHTEFCMRINKMAYEKLFPWWSWMLPLKRAESAIYLFNPYRHVLATRKKRIIKKIWKRESDVNSIKHNTMHNLWSK